MAKRERVVGLTVKAKDQFSSTYRKLEQAQKKATAAASAASRRETIGAAKDDVAAAIANYKALAAEIARYRQVQTSALQTGKLTAAEMREVGEALKLVRDRAREAVPIIQQKRQALADLNNAAAGGFAAFSKSADAMKRNAASAAAGAAADQRAAAAAKLRADIQARLNAVARSGFADWSRYVDTVNRIQTAEEKSAAAARLKADIQNRLNTQVKSGFNDWSRYASVIDRVQAEDSRAAAAAERRVQVQARLNSIAGSGFAAWSRYADTIVRIRTADERSAEISERKAAVQARLNAAAQSGFVAFSRMASEMEGSASATSRNASASASAATELRKLDTASKSAAAAQKGLRSQVDATSNSLDRQGSSAGKASRGGARGNDQDVDVYGLKPWQLVNLGYQVNDVVSGLAMGQAPLQVLAQQAGQFAQIWPEVMVGLARSIPTLTVFGAALAPFIAAAMRLKEAGDSVEYFNGKLALSADGSRYSAEGLADITRQLTEMSIAVDDARKMVADFASKGISADQFEGLAEMAKQLNSISGEGVVAAADRLSTAFSGSVDDVRKLDQELNFLTASQYEQIRAMEDSGDAAGALAVAQDALAQRLEAGKSKTGEWAAAFKELKGAWDELVSAMEDSGVLSFVVREIEYAGRDLKNFVKDVRGAGKAIGDAFEDMTTTDTGDLKREIDRLTEYVETMERLGQGSDPGTLDARDRLSGARRELAELLSYQRELNRLEQERNVSSEGVTRATEEQKKAAVDVAEVVSENLTEMQQESAAVEATNRERFIEERLLKARNDALEKAKQLNQDFLGLTKEQTEAIRQQAGSLYDRKNPNYEAKYTAERGTPQGAQMEELITATVKLAEQMGVSAKDLLTAMSYETGGTFDPWKAGPTTQYGQHRGLIQWGEPQAAKYGVTGTSSISSQIEAVGKYLADAGVKAGDGLLQIYAAINAGNAKNINASDANNGGAPGTVLDKVSGQMGDHQARADGLLGAYGGAVEAATELAKLDKERLETESDYLVEYQKRVEQQKFELDLLSKSAREAAVAKAIRDEENRAKEAGLSLTAEQRAETERLAAAEFDRQNVNLEVNKLMEQRETLLERMELAQETGDQSLLSTTATELEGINTKLDEAIQKAIAFWQSMGGEGSAAAIAQLQNMQMAIGQSTERMRTQFLPTAEDINERLAEVGSNAFSAFAQAIANGENAADAFFNALLQGLADFAIEIGKAIVKQALFNALTGGSAGGGAGGGISGFFMGLFGAKHDGGIVGQRGMTRMVNPMVFADAQKYHGGGVISGSGLTKNEVPIIALRNEEVLTEDDPRHVSNGGGRQAPVNLKNVNVFDPTDVLEASLANSAGERILLNFLTRNSNKINGALGR